MREAQVRARATGILLKRLFVEGSNVKEGQVLFEIDPAPLQASLNSAKALMART
jgi:membrane fusion protein (multidrug efflux system)